MEKGIAIIIAVMLVGSVIAVEHFYGWKKVGEDVEELGGNYLDKLSKDAGVFWEGFKGYFMPEDSEEKVINEKDVAIEEKIGELANKTGIEFIQKVSDRLANLTGVVREVDVEKYKAEMGNLTDQVIGLVEISLGAFRTVIIPLPVEFIEALTESGLIQEFTSLIAESFSTLSYAIQEFIPMAQEVLKQLSVSFGQIISSLIDMGFEISASMGAPKSYWKASY